MKTRFIVPGAITIALLASTAMAQTPVTATQPETNSASVTQPYKGQWRVDKIIDLDVYNQNDEKLGEISDLLTDQTGKVQTAILAVGGFLGVGERMVAVSFDQLKFVNEPFAAKTASGPLGTQYSTPIRTRADTNTQTTTGSAAPARPARSASEQWYPDHAVINLTADQLKAMPHFEYK